MTFIKDCVVGNTFQRIGSLSNAHVGLEFEQKAKRFFEKSGIFLYKNHEVMVGVGDLKKFIGLIWDAPI
jgi:hypothetical protein